MKKNIIMILLLALCLCGCENATQGTEQTETETDSQLHEDTEQSEELDTSAESDTDNSTETETESAVETETSGNTETTETTEKVEETEESQQPENSETEKEPVEPEVPKYTFEEYAEAKTMYVKSSVNVRDLPETSGNKVGSLSLNDEVKVLAKCNETGWYKIEYKDSIGYVSSNYLVNEKIEIEEPPKEETPEVEPPKEEEPEEEPSTPDTPSDVVDKQWLDIGFTDVVEERKLSKEDTRSFAEMIGADSYDEKMSVSVLSETSETYLNKENSIITDIFEYNSLWEESIEGQSAIGKVYQIAIIGYDFSRDADGDLVMEDNGCALEIGTVLDEKTNTVLHSTEAGHSYWMKEDAFSFNMKIGKNLGWPDADGGYNDMYIVKFYFVTEDGKPMWSAYLFTMEGTESVLNYVED